MGPQDTIQMEIHDSVKTALIDCSVSSDRRYRPSLILNDKTRGVKVISTILSEMEICDSFSFSIAFITNDGLALLRLKLEELRKRGIKGRIITTDYLNFNDPDSLYWLLHHSDIEVRVYDKENFHTKGYLFHNGRCSSLVIGSSNLTQTALTTNKEWNLKITSLENGELLKDVASEFENMWISSTPLSDNWIEEYRLRHIRSAIQRDREIFSFERHGVVNPNQMQEEALCQLDSLRRGGKDRALLISATGTGKTFLSAFDVRNFKPKKVLFLVHREQILDDARESYSLILGNGYTYGKLSGSVKEIEADILFSTIQSMSKSDCLEGFEPDHFDYIVCDEAHHSTAEMYSRIINHFKPKFMLGMTATPERMDQIDVFQLFDYNIAYELRLQKAMEMDMLCPFHYYGIIDVLINGRTIGDEDFEKNFGLLTSDERVKHIIEKAEYYSHSGKRVKGLIFCSRNEEAALLSSKINAYPGRNYKTVALSGESTVEEREDAIRRLEKDDGPDCLDYILSCDIFNEGVDIPQVNQILMLRPTKSAIIFVQQLGRGLRKSKNKEFVVVIDFIGNYNNNFLIPVALSGDRTYNKDVVRRYLINGNDVIPGCSSVNFDYVSKKRIYDSICSSNMTKTSELKKEYQMMKIRLGRSPTLVDFYEGGSLDPRVLIDKYKNLNIFENKIKECESLDSEETKVLSFISSSFINGKRADELIILDSLIDKGSIMISDLLRDRREDSVYSALSVLNGDFSSKGQILIDVDDGKISCSHLMKKCLSDEKFKRYAEDVLKCGLSINAKEYSSLDDIGFALYGKYSRKDVVRLLNWKSEGESSTMYGYRVKYKTCPIFVTYNKRDDISETTKYDEDFVDQRVFNWMTRSRVKLESSEVTSIMNSNKNGLKILFFICKSDDEGGEFYYLGQVDPILDMIRQTSISGKSVVNIPLRFRNQIRDDLYAYLTS